MSKIVLVQIAVRLPKYFIFIFNGKAILHYNNNCWRIVVNVPFLLKSIR